MNLRDLEYIVALADTGHFGRAAARCHVTQPTLSMQIAKVEQELGAPLFERGGRKVTLTKAGEKIVAKAGAVLDTVQEIREIARGSTGPLAGPFYLGAIPTVGPYLLPHILPTLKRLYPDLKLFLREEMTERLLERLRNADLDAAILSLPLDDSALETAPIYTEEFVAALPEGHPLASKRRVTLEEMAGENILLLEEGNCMRDQTLQLCKGARPAAQDEFRASSIESLRQMISAGLGCTFLPKLSTTGSFAEASPIAVRPFKKPVPARDLVLAWRRTYPRAEALSELASALRKDLRL